MTWLMYKDKCPECGGEVLRHDLSRYDFCRGNCNILLNIPSFRETEKEIFVVSRKLGEGKWEKITKDEYHSLSEAIKKFCYKYLRVKYT